MAEARKAPPERQAALPDPKPKRLGISLNIKKELRATVAPEVAHEDYVLFVSFGHELDDATDEPQSVTSGKASPSMVCSSP